MDHQEREYDIQCNSYHGSDDLNHFSLPSSSQRSYSRPSSLPKSKQNETISKSPFKLNQNKSYTPISDPHHSQLPTFGQTKSKATQDTLTRPKSARPQNQTPLNSIKNSLAPGLPEFQTNAHLDLFKSTIGDKSTPNTNFRKNYDEIIRQESESDISNQKKNEDYNLKNLKLSNRFNNQVTEHQRNKLLQDSSDQFDSGQFDSIDQTISNSFLNDQELISRNRNDFQGIVINNNIEESQVTHSIDHRKRDQVNVQDLGLSELSDDYKNNDSHRRSSWENQFNRVFTTNPAQKKPMPVISTPSASKEYTPSRKINFEYDQMIQTPSEPDIHQNQKNNNQLSEMIKFSQIKLSGRVFESCEPQHNNQSQGSFLNLVSVKYESQYDNLQNKEESQNSRDSGTSSDHIKSQDKNISHETGSYINQKNNLQEKDISRRQLHDQKGNQIHESSVSSKGLRRDTHKTLHKLGDSSMPREPVVELKTPHNSKVQNGEDAQMRLYMQNREKELEKFYQALKESMEDMYEEKIDGLNQCFEKQEKLFSQKEKTLNQVLKELKSKNEELREVIKSKNDKIEVLVTDLTAKKDSMDLLEIQVDALQSNELNYQREIESNLTSLEAQLIDQYKLKEDQLSLQFQQETAVFMETIQAEMSEILDSKGLTQERRLELEREYTEELQNKDLDQLKQQINLDYLNLLKKHLKIEETEEESAQVSFAESLSIWLDLFKEQTTEMLTSEIESRFEDEYSVKLDLQAKILESKLNSELRIVYDQDYQLKKQQSELNLKQELDQHLDALMLKQQEFTITENNSIQELFHSEDSTQLDSYNLKEHSEPSTKSDQIKRLVELEIKKKTTLLELNNKRKLDKLLKDLEAEFGKEKEKLQKEVEEERNEIGRQKSLMHVRLKNVKKMKNEIKEEFTEEFKTKEDALTKKLDKVTTQYSDQIQALKEEKIVFVGKIKKLEAQIIEVKEQTKAETETSLMTTFEKKEEYYKSVIQELSLKVSSLQAKMQEYSDSLAQYEEKKDLLHNLQTKEKSLEEKSKVLLLQEQTLKNKFNEFENHKEYLQIKHQELEEKLEMVRIEEDRSRIKKSEVMEFKQLLKDEIRSEMKREMATSQATSQRFSQRSDNNQNKPYKLDHQEELDYLIKAGESCSFGVNSQQHNLNIMNSGQKLNFNQMNSQGLGGRFSSYKKKALELSPISQGNQTNRSKSSRSASPLKQDSQFKFFEAGRYMLTSPEEKKHLAENLIKKYMKIDDSSAKKLTQGRFTEQLEESNPPKFGFVNQNTFSVQHLLKSPRIVEESQECPTDDEGQSNFHIRNKFSEGKSPNQSMRFNQPLNVLRERIQDQSNSFGKHLPPEEDDGILTEAGRLNEMLGKLTRNLNLKDKFDAVSDDNSNKSESKARTKKVTRLSEKFPPKLQSNTQSNKKETGPPMSDIQRLKEKIKQQKTPQSAQVEDSPNKNSNNNMVYIDNLVDKIFSKVPPQIDRVKLVQENPDYKMNQEEKISMTGSKTQDLVESKFTNFDVDSLKLTFNSGKMTSILGESKEPETYIQPDPASSNFYSTTNSRSSNKRSKSPKFASGTHNTENYARNNQPQNNVFLNVEQKSHSKQQQKSSNKARKSENSANKKELVDDAAELELYLKLECANVADRLLTPDKQYDSKQVIQMKVLRLKVLNFKMGDQSLKTSFEEKLKFLSSTEFVRAFNDNQNYSKIGYTEVMNITSDFRKLNMLWEDCFFSYKQRLDLLDILSDLKSLVDRKDSNKVSQSNDKSLMTPDTFKLFHKRITQLIKDLQELKNTEKILFAKLRKREMICNSLQQNMKNVAHNITIKQLNRELLGSRVLLKNINDEILNELKHSEKLDESLLVLGVEFKTLMQVDHFEEEYLVSCEGV